MDKVLYFVKIFALAQVVLILAFIILIYFLRLVYKRQGMKKYEIKARVHNILHQAFNSRDSSMLIDNSSFLKNHIDPLLDELHDLVAEKKGNEYLQEFLPVLSKEILLPRVFMLLHPMMDF